jgi:hypothetical protein
MSKCDVSRKLIDSSFPDSDLPSLAAALGSHLELVTWLSVSDILCVKKIVLIFAVKQMFHCGRLDILSREDTVVEPAKVV